MMPVYVLKLGLKVCYINVKAQKINSSTIEIFKIVLTCFQIWDKLKKFQFFQKLFLLANINIKVWLEILFGTLSNIDILFLKWKLI